MTIITGFPSLSFARTRKELGIIWMSVKPALLKVVPNFLLNGLQAV
jgi:hypothetical protein